VHRRLLNFARYVLPSAVTLVTALIVPAIGIICLFCWWLDITFRFDDLSPISTLTPAVAIALILAGVSLGIHRSLRASRPWQRIAAACAILVTLIGFLTLLESLTGIGFHLDLALVFHTSPEGKALQPSFLTGLMLTLTGLALWIIDFIPRRGPPPSELFSLLAFHASLLALFGHAFGDHSLYQFETPPDPGMGLLAALLITLLSTGVLAVRPDRGFVAVLLSESGGGVLVRRLLLTPLAISLVVLGLSFSLKSIGIRTETDLFRWFIVLTYFVLFTGVILWIGSTVDRAEIARNQAERAVQAAAAEVRDLYDNAPCGYHSVRPDGTIVAINRIELKWIGYEADEVIGRIRFADLLSPASRDTYQNAFARLKVDGFVNNVELDIARKDGTTLPVLASSTAIRDGEGRYLASRTTLTDLTERKRAEAAIQLFADVVRNIPIGLLIFQLDGPDHSTVLRVRSANTYAARLLGIPLDSAIGQNVYEVFPAIPVELFRRYSEVARSDRADMIGEIQYGDSHIAERWWSVQAFPLPDRSVGIAFQDVSDRKQAEAKIHQLNEHLEERVRTRTAELAEANRDLAHKNDENEMFVYSVSHDLRSPLVNLQGFSKELDKDRNALASLLTNESVPDTVREASLSLLNGKMVKSIGFIQTAVLRLSGIIDALLRLSRIGRVEYRREYVDLRRIVDQVVGSLHGTITERGATVRIGTLPPAWGDRSAIEQVFANLVGNALTYLHADRPGEIEIGCLPADSPGVLHGFRTYFVKDNGLGIPSAHCQKIFQVFQRAHPGIGTGEGIGLAIVFRVVERHHGRVWVESEAGQGSTFFVTLPIPTESRPILPTPFHNPVEG
jgi:PAS domain S-box-containing protein